MDKKSKETFNVKRKKKCCDLIMITILLLAFSNNLLGFKKMIITEEIVNLRSQPIPAPNGLMAPALSRNIGKQDSQLLFGERILGMKDPENPGWIKIKALEQELFKNEEWQGYPGYIENNQAKPVTKFTEHNNVIVKNIKAFVYKEASTDSEKIKTFSIGTKLQTKNVINSDRKKHLMLWYKINLFDSFGFIQSSDIRKLSNERKSENKLRNQIVKQTMKFLNPRAPYLWGGRSGYDPNRTDQITSIDCSGLIDLVFGSCGIKVPRDAHDQLLKSNKIELGKNLKPGDLVFLARNRKKHLMLRETPRMNHVLIYIGDSKMIETTGRGYSSTNDVDNPEIFTTRIVDSFKYFGKTIEELTTKDTVIVDDGNTKSERLIFFGSYID